MCNIYIMGTQAERRKQMFETIMTENFPNSCQVPTTGPRSSENTQQDEWKNKNKNRKYT